jgi:tetratricopeptide (TPR) repeat protein
VADFGAYKYRVFLTSSPSDQAWGKWLRAALEAFHIDRDLIRRQTIAGPVPKSLRPVFWDCPQDATDGTSSKAGAAGFIEAVQGLGVATRIAKLSQLPGWARLHHDGARQHALADPTRSPTHASRPDPKAKRREAERRYAQKLIEHTRVRELTDRTADALQASQFLIVLCSPAAAQDPRIDEQIRRFNSMHRDGRVIPVIVAGTPGHPVRDCFPKALRYKLSAEREPTDECGEPIADARPEGDGKEVALQRVVGRLLGLPFEEVEQRGERARRFRRDIRHATVAAVLAMLIAYEATLTLGRAELAANEALLDRTVQMAATLANKAVTASTVLGLPQRVSTDLLAASEEMLRDLIELGGESPRLRYRKAALMIELARRYAALGDHELPRGRVTEAARLLRSLASEVPGNPAWQRDLAVSYDQLGDALTAQGRLKEAISAYRTSAALAERVAQLAVHDPAAQGALGSDPATRPRHHRDLATIYIKAGDAAVAQGAFKSALDDALESYQASLAIDRRLADADRSDTRWQYGLLIAQEKIGDVLRVQGELDQALASYRAGQAIAEALLKIEPGNLVWKRAFSVSQIKIGDVLALAGKPEEAMATYRVSNTLAERVTAADPGNAQWQNHLAISHDRIGSVLHARGDLVAALREYRTSVAIGERAAIADPDNSAWQRDLGIAHEHTGEVLQALGNLEDALAEFEAKRAIVARLAEVQPDNPGWQFDLGNSHARIGFVLEGRGRFAEALKEYEACLAIGRRFVAADPGNVQWQRDLAVSYQRLAEARLRQGKTTQALAELRRGRDIMAVLLQGAKAAAEVALDISPDIAQWTADLARFDTRIATLSGRAAPRPLAEAPPAAAVAAACDGPCPPGVTAASVLVASDLRTRIDALPAATSKLDN